MEPIQKREVQAVPPAQAVPPTQLAQPAAIERDSAPLEAVARSAPKQDAVFPTLISKGELHRFRVSCEGQPTLEGLATDESEAIRAYRFHLNLEAAQRAHGSRVPTFTVERL